MHDELNELINLCDEFAELDDIRTQDLKETGYNNYRISKLASGKMPILLRTKRGHYAFNSEILNKVDSLFRIEKYRELIKEAQYNDAINFINISDLEYFSDYDYLLLHLLSHRVNVPEELKPITRDLDIENLLKNSNDKKIQELDEKIKLKIAMNFGYIHVHFRKKRHDKTLSPEEQTLKRLLQSIKNRYLIVRDQHIIAIQEKRYTDVLLFLKEKSEQRRLKQTEVITAKLINVFLQIQETGVIPKETITESASFLEDIDNNNFKRASERVSYKIHALLLTDILTLIEQIKNDNIRASEITSDDTSINDVTLEDILTVLTIKDTEKSFKLINYYLRKIGKEEYLNLVLNLVKISYIENDIAFIVPIRALINLKNNTLYISPDIYLSKFNEAVNSRSIYEAAIYILILTELQKLGLIENINIEKLNDRLDNAKGTEFNPEKRSHLSAISSLMIRNCLSLEGACTYLNLDNEKKNIVFLMYAKEYYYIKNYVTGDSLIRYVESQKDKSPKVKKLLIEIIRDKNFYANRAEEIGASLILAPNI